MTSAEQMQILSRIWGRDVRGYVFLPHIPKEFARTAKRKASWFEGTAFAWPEDRRRIKAHIEKHNDDELYFSVAVFSKPSRKAENVLTADRLYADLDGVDPRELDDEYRPTHAWQTSEGRYAGVWEMTENLPAPYAPGGINHRLTQHLGADPSGWDTTQVLRVPGSANNKADKREGERGLQLWTGDGAYTPDHFDGLPEVKGVDPRIAELSTPDVDAVDADAAWDRVRLKVSTGVRRYMRMREVEEGLDRSDVLWQIERELADAGCSLIEIVAIVKGSIWNKFKGRSNEMKQLCAEAGKAIALVPGRSVDPADSDEDLEAEVQHETRRQLVYIKARRAAQEQDSAQGAAQLISRLPGALTPEELKAATLNDKRFRVHQILPATANALICGGNKTGKTERALELDRSLITGEPYLDQFEVVEPIRGNILKLNYEVSAATLSDWIDAMGFSGLGDRIRILNLRGLKVPLLTDAGAEWLIEQCRAYDVEVLDIDPAGQMMTAADLHDEEDNNLIKRITSRLDEIKREAGVSELILPIHAHREARPIRPRGASAWGGWLDSQISLRLKNPDNPASRRIMSAWGRDINDVPEAELEYNKETRLCRYLVPHTAPLRNLDGTVEVNLSEAEEPGIGTGRTGRRPKDAAYYDKRMQAYMAKNPKASRNWAAKEIGGTRTRALEAYDRWKLTSDGGSKISGGLLDEDV